ncbi:TIGR02391 family protein [Embleya sp. NPDC127516]|uniref:TIGR02391 family protein n=1 Tax=Embleya sp. NPDC127516 TaxID=3363990 RepID=UPI00380DB415
MVAPGRTAFDRTGQGFPAFAVLPGIGGRVEGRMRPVAVPIRIDEADALPRVLPDGDIDDGSDTFRSRHDGAGSFARGVFSAIRNPIAHELDHELEENEALEQLAAFSILARWIDAAGVEAVS